MMRNITFLGIVIFKEHEFKPVYLSLMHKCVHNGMIFAFSCSTTILTLKKIIRIMENHSGFSGCAKSYNKFVSSRS